MWGRMNETDQGPLNADPSSLFMTSSSEPPIHQILKEMTPLDPISNYSSLEEDGALDLPFPFHIFNGTEEAADDYIFDRIEVRAIFLTFYTLVFCSCFFGNLMVILVVTLHWRMRSITNFCLGNLAFADMCVGVFCVYQNISSYLMNSWIFGEFMCKMYHFISSLSTTASILILVVICIERYLAIIHPMRCKQMLTLNRLRVTIIFVWVLSALISSPRFYYFSTMTMPYSHDGNVEVLCVPNRLKYDSKLVDMISLALLFLLPLAVISILYFRIGVVLWQSSTPNMPAASTSADSGSSSSLPCDSIATTPSPRPKGFRFSFNRNKGKRASRRSAGSFQMRNGGGQCKLLARDEENCCSCTGHSLGKDEIPISPYLDKRESSSSTPMATEPIVLVKFEKKGSLRSCRRNQCTILMRPAVSASTINSDKDTGSIHNHNHNHNHHPSEYQMTTSSNGNGNGHPGCMKTPSNGTIKPKKMRVIRGSKYGMRALQCRRRIIRMLIVIVVAFAICHLPFHARKIWQYWGKGYKGGSEFSSVLTPITFLIMYAQSGLNPILYAFMSKKFRMSFADLLCCNIRRSLKISRNLSVRSTNAIQLSQAA